MIWDYLERRFENAEGRQASIIWSGAHIISRREIEGGTITLSFFEAKKAKVKAWIKDEAKALLESGFEEKEAAR